MGTITPHTISLLSLPLLALNLTPTSTPISVNPTIISSFVTQQISSSFPIQPSLRELCKTLNQLTRSEEMSDSLVEFLQSINSLDDFFEFMTVTIKDYVEDPELLTRDHTISVFYRKTYLQFQKLSFEITASLYESFLDYVNSFENNAEVTEEEKSTMELNRHQIELFLDNQVDLFESSQIPFEFHEFQEIMEGLLSKAPNLMKIHYLKYLNCLRVGEFTESLDHLHRFFDYCLANKFPKGILQQALLCLAAFYTRFDFKEEAIDILKEVTRTARRVNDHKCLSYAQKWLNLLTLEKKNRSKIEFSQANDSDFKILNSLPPQTKDIPYLQSLSQLSNAEYFLNKGFSSEVLDHLKQSLESTDDNIMSPLPGAKYSLSATAWDLSGNNTLSSYYTKLLLDFYPVESSKNNVCLGHIQLAYQEAESGNFDKVYELFSHIREGSKLNPKWREELTHFGDILFKSYISNYELGNAELVFVSIMNSKQKDFSNFAIYQMKIGKYKEAFQLLSSQLKQVSDNYTNFKASHSHLLYLISETFMQQNQPIHALPYVLRGLSLSQHFRIAKYYFASILQLAELFINFNLLEESLALIDEILPQLLAHFPYYLKSKAYLIQVKTYLSMETIQLPFPKILKKLTIAYSGFEKVNSLDEMIETSYLQSRICDTINSIEERNKYAKKYRELVELKKHNMSKHPDPDVLYFQKVGSKETFCRNK